MLAMVLVVGGLIAYRWDTNLVGQLVAFGVLPQEIIPRYTHYVPSLIEFATAAGALAFAALAFTLGVRYLKVVDHSSVVEAEETEEVQPLPVGVGTD